MHFYNSFIQGLYNVHYIHTLTTAGINLLIGSSYRFGVMLKDASTQRQKEPRALLAAGATEIYQLWWTE